MACSSSSHKPKALTLPCTGLDSKLPSNFSSSNLSQPVRTTHPTVGSIIQILPAIPVQLADKMDPPIFRQIWTPFTRIWIITSPWLIRLNEVLLQPRSRFQLLSNSWPAQVAQRRGLYCQTVTTSQTTVITWSRTKLLTDNNNMVKTSRKVSTLVTETDEWRNLNPKVTSSGCQASKGRRITSKNPKCERTTMTWTCQCKRDQRWIIKELRNWRALLANKLTLMTGFKNQLKLTTSNKGVMICNL